MRAEEMWFLGMSRKPKTLEEQKNDPILKMQETQKKRRADRDKFGEKYEEDKEDIKDKIRDFEGPDIEEHMLKERRDWILKYREEHSGKLPDEIKPFYDKDKVEAPLTAEEKEAKELQDAEDAKGKKKKKEAKKDGKKKGKKKKGDDDDKE